MAFVVKIQFHQFYAFHSILTRIIWIILWNGFEGQAGKKWYSAYVDQKCMPKIAGNQILWILKICFAICVCVYVFSHVCMSQGCPEKGTVSTGVWLTLVFWKKL